MALIHFSFSVFFLIYCMSANGLQQTTINNLRQFKVQMALSRFAAPRDILAEEFRNRKERDVACGNDVELELHQRTPNMIDSSTSANTGQLFIVFGAIEDYTLKEELSREMKEKIAVTYRFLLVGIPFTSGTRHGILFTSILSDSPKKVLHPYVTNYQTLKQIDRIEETSDGAIFMYKGDDVMTLNIQYDKECQRVESAALKNDFLQLTEHDHVSTSYPETFDWGCESLGLNVSFCKSLEENRCGLERAGSDICTTKFMTPYQPCPANFSIMNMTGFFQNEVLPFVSASELPLVSFEADWVNSTGSAELVFPCFSVTD